MDVIVVGAGVIGCAVAWELASRGAVVRVVERRGTGAGATRASAGMLAPQIEGHVAPLLALGERSLAMYDRFVARVTADAARPIEYERSGILEVALTGTEAAALQAAAGGLAARGVPHDLLEGTDAARLEPGLPPAVTAALHVHGQGYVAAGALTNALAEAASRRGVQFTAANVERIDGGGAPAVVLTGGEALAADAIVIAAGSWSATLGGAAADAVKPIRGQLLHLRVRQRPASRVIWGSACYLVPWHDGTVLAGATVEDVGFDETATASAVRRLLEASGELLPALREASFEGVRVGLRPMARDELPAIGPSSTMRQVFYATGHYRNGVLLAPLTASLTADLVMGTQAGPELALARPDRLGL